VAKDELSSDAEAFGSSSPRRGHGSSSAEDDASRGSAGTPDDVLRDLQLALSTERARVETLKQSCADKDMRLHVLKQSCADKDMQLAFHLAQLNLKLDLLADKNSQLNALKTRLGEMEERNEQLRRGNERKDQLLLQVMAASNKQESALNGHGGATAASRHVHEASVLLSARSAAPATAGTANEALPSQLPAQSALGVSHANAMIQVILELEMSNEALKTQVEEVESVCMQLRLANGELLHCVRQEHHVIQNTFDCSVRLVQDLAAMEHVLLDITDELCQGGGGGARGGNFRCRKLGEGKGRERGGSGPEGVRGSVGESAASRSALGRTASKGSHSDEETERERARADSRAHTCPPTHASAVLSSPQTGKEKTRCVVHMLQSDIFCAEGHSTQTFGIFRTGTLDQEVEVAYATSSKKGLAQPGTDYIAKEGVVTFGKGSPFTTLDIEICDDDDWMPIRSFEVELMGIRSGSAVIGDSRTTKCICVDDDIYPRKVERNPQIHPLSQSEMLIPSCIKSDEFYTPDELSDDMLIKYFIVERWKLLWPHSLWAAIWCVYRAAYHVGMSLVLVIFVDVVWFDDATIAALNAADATNATQIGSGGGMGEAEGQDGNFGQSLVLSTVLTGIVVMATYCHSCTETWVAENAKLGLTGKHLRDWMASQIMYVVISHNHTLAQARAHPNTHGYALVSVRVSA